MCMEMWCTRFWHEMRAKVLSGDRMDCLLSCEVIPNEKTKGQQRQRAHANHAQNQSHVELWQARPRRIDSRHANVCNGQTENRVGWQHVRERHGHHAAHKAAEEAQEIRAKACQLRVDDLSLAQTEPEESEERAIEDPQKQCAPQQ